MTKTFREILAEKDDEFVYYVRSTADIHLPELFERIRLSLIPYRIKSFEKDSYKPVGKENKYFPDDPHAPSYSIRAVTGLKIPKGFTAALAMDANIHVSHMRLDGEGVDLNDPEPTQDAQRLVGTKRIADFIGELQADRKTRKEATTTREVYESFCTTHRGIADILKKPLRNGYYTVEAFRQAENDYLMIKGPLASRPHLEYRDRIAVVANVVSESITGGVYNGKLLIERGTK